MKMKQLMVFIVLCLFLLIPSFAGSVCSETLGIKDLINVLTNNMGVTESQAAGGAGALFDMAKGALSATDYGQVDGAIPGIESLIKAAPAVSTSTSDVSSKIGGLGSITKTVESANKFAAVNDQFKQLGLDAGMVAKFIPVLLSFADSAGGESVMNILKSVWE